MRIFGRLCLCSPLWLVALSAAGQFPQYARPGDFSSSGESVQQKLEKGYREARWSLGDLRINPVLALREVAYVDNVFSSADAEEQISDFTATLTAGLLGYLHLGPKVIASGYARPDVVWWRDTDALRTENLSFGVGVFGLFNRLTVSTTVERLESQGFLNVESEVPVTQLTDSADFTFEIEAGRRFVLFGSASVNELRFAAGDLAELSDLTVTELDRDEDVVRGGVRLSLTEALSVDFGVERSEADFLDNTTGRSNSGTNPFLGLLLSGQNLSASLSVVERELEFAPNSERSRLEDSTGDGSLTWGFGDRSDLTAYAARSVIYSAANADSIFITQRSGLSYSWHSGAQLKLTVFAEQGENDFSTLGAPNDDRRDDFEALGATLQIPLLRSFTVRLGLIQFDLDSNVPGFSRSTTSILTAVELNTDLTPW